MDRRQGTVNFAIEMEIYENYKGRFHLSGRRKGCPYRGIRQGLRYVVKLGNKTGKSSVPLFTVCEVAV